MSQNVVEFDFSQFEALVDALRSDHPLQGETLSGLSDALRAIADSIDNQNIATALSGDPHYTVASGLDDIATAIREHAKAIRDCFGDQK